MRILSLLTLLFAVAINADEAVRSDAVPRADLWIAHLDYFTAAHPQLSDEQKSIVAQGRALLAGGLLAKLRSKDGREAADTRRALEAFKGRASSAFSRELYAEAFVRLNQPRLATPGVPGGATSMMPDCECSGSGECGGFECYNVTCRFQPGCGMFGTEICVGLC